MVLTVTDRTFFWNRRVVACRRTITRHMRHGSADAAKFWTIELVRALRCLYQREIC